MLYRGPRCVVDVVSPGATGYCVVGDSVRAESVRLAEPVVVVGEALVVGLVGEPEVVGVVGEPVVVSVPGRVAAGSMNSVVDKTLVANVVVVVDGVMMKASRSRVVGAGCVVAGVVSSVVCGWLHSSDIWTTPTTRAARSATPTPPAANVAPGVRCQGSSPDSLCRATGADPSLEPIRPYTRRPMSTSDQVRAILRGAVRAYRAEPGHHGRPDVPCELDRIACRLNQPIRIALAGSLKAGKSTLVNALVGEEIAPTDATEATRIATWFRHGPTPRVTANRYDGLRSNVPISRGTAGAGLTFEFGVIDPQTVADLDVEWPAAELIDATIVDTPGHLFAVPGRLRSHSAAAGSRRRGAAGGRGGVPDAHAQRRGHRVAQTDR